MVSLVWTEISRNDLKDIFDFISRDSHRYASITVSKIYQRAQTIIANPFIGRVVPEFENKNIREIVTGNYRIVYRIINDHQVDILRIYHSARYLSDDQLKL